MSRRAWLALAAAGGLAVLGCMAIAAVVVFLNFGDDDSSAASACRAVSAGKLDAIAAGLEPGLSLRNGQAVRSDDYEDVWMIAADLQGPGLDGGHEVAVWASSNLSPNSGPIFAVDGLAREFSDWGHFGGVTDHGVNEARACVA